MAVREGSMVPELGLFRTLLNGEDGLAPAVGRIGRRVDPDCLGLGNTVNESFRMLRPSQAKDAFTLFENTLGPAVMDIIRGDHGDTRAAMLGVVPSEKGPAEHARDGHNCASEKGLSSLTRGRLRDRVTPRSASSCAMHLPVMGAPRSECRVSTRGLMPCLRQDCLMRLVASAELSRSATIHPTMYLLKMSSRTWRRKCVQVRFGAVATNSGLVQGGWES